jgi:xanthine dehydrogenase accessory factor
MRKAPDAMRRADPEMPSGPPGFVKYGITADEAHRFGLPCGGTLELLLEYDPDAAALAALVQALDAGPAGAAHGAAGRRRVTLAQATRRPKSCA